MPSRSRYFRYPILAIAALLFFMIPGPLHAQAAPATISLNAVSCPLGYNQVSDCTKLEGVSIRVFGGGEPLGDLTSVLDSSADLQVPVGTAIALELLGGAPANSLLEPMPFEFEAVEGINPVTMVFVIQETPGDPTDTDGDGVTDVDEAALGTDPEDPDSDDDGVLDGGEVNVGTDPLNPDTDGDGFTDLEELDRATDPLDPASYPVDTEPNSLVATVYNCPVGYEGKDPWTDCTAPAVGVDMTFSLNASEFGLTATTDATGSVAFTDLGSGEFTLREDLSDLDFGIGRISLVCWGDPVSPEAPEPRQINYSQVETGAYGFTLTSGEEISCTWFNIPAAAGDDAPAPAPAPTVTPRVTGLPSTGSGPADTAIADHAMTISGILSGTSLLIAAAVLMTRPRPRNRA